MSYAKAIAAVAPDANPAHVQAWLLTDDVIASGMSATDLDALAESYGLPA